MLKTRLLSALVGVIILFASAFGPEYILKAAVFGVTLICILEFFKTMKIAPVFMILAFVICVPFIFYYNNYNVIYFSLFLLVFFSFVLVILDYKNKNVNDVYLTVFGTIFISFCLSHVLKVRDMENGNLLIWFIFFGAWITDTFAYFVGVNLGKHKLTPISPKKSVEGAIGGILGCLIVVIAYGLFINAKYNVGLPIHTFIIMSLIGSIAAEFGDLAASLIKRSVEVKDFGTIMPGHGGAVDRFDSIFFVAPAIYFYLYFFI